MRGPSLGAKYTKMSTPVLVQAIDQAACKHLLTNLCRTGQTPISINLCKNLLSWLIICASHLAQNYGIKQKIYGTTSSLSKSGSGLALGKMVPIWRGGRRRRIKER